MNNQEINTTIKKLINNKNSPNYVGNLNIMHMLEINYIYTDPKLASEYTKYLCSNTKYPIIATAKDRAEAFIHAWKFKK